MATTVVAVALTMTACDPGYLGAHNNDIRQSATCEIHRQHRHATANPNWYMGITTDVHGASSTCHSDIAAYAARVSGVANGGTYWSGWVWGHPAQANISGVGSSAYSEHQYCPNWQDCVYGTA